jgi:hypothetical protein
MQSDAWQDLGDLDGPALTGRLLDNLDALFEGCLRTAEREDSKLATLPEPLQAVASQLARLRDQPGVAPCVLHE